jgi:hypothetical protein
MDLQEVIQTPIRLVTRDIRLKASVWAVQRQDVSNETLRFMVYKGWLIGSWKTKAGLRILSQRPTWKDIVFVKRHIPELKYRTIKMLLDRRPSPFQRKLLLKEISPWRD